MNRKITLEQLLEARISTPPTAKAMARYLKKRYNIVIDASTLRGRLLEVGLGLWNTQTKREKNTARKTIEKCIAETYIKDIVNILQRRKSHGTETL